MLSENERVVPNLKSVRYSLKKLLSPMVTVPGREPAASPVSVGLPKTPLELKAEMVTELDGGPPSIKSNAKLPVVPAGNVVFTLT